MNYFWNSWKNKTKQEKNYISASKRAIDWLRKQPLSKDIVAIYIKGSFVDRELTKISDVDMVPVMKSNESTTELKVLRDKVKNSLVPVDILPISLQELESNEIYQKPLPGKVQMKGKPDQFIALMPYHRLVYGKPLKTNGFKSRTPQKIYEDLKNFIVKVGIPLYYKKEFGFRQLGKQFANLVWWEEKLKGNVFPPTWKDLKKNCPKNKLLQRTIKFRIHPIKDETIRTKYVEDLKKYLR